MPVKTRAALSKARNLLDGRVFIKVLGAAALLLLLPYYHRYYSGRLIRQTPGDPGGEMPINTLITQVRDQLYQIELDMLKKRQTAMFEVKTFDLEISFVVRNDTKTGAQLLAVSGEAQSGSERAHKITLHMEALQRPAAAHTESPSTISKPPDFVVK